MFHYLGLGPIVILVRIYIVREGLINRFYISGNFNEDDLFMGDFNEDGSFIGDYKEYKEEEEVAVQNRLLAFIKIYKKHSL